MPRATIAAHAPENSTAAMLENILARFARIESRWIEHERRAAATLPLRPEPDPPDGPPLYTAAQQPYQPYTWQQPPSSGLNTHWHPHPPTPAFDQSPNTYMESYEPLQIPYAGDHREQPDYQPPWLPYTDSESHVHQRNCSLGYHPWQPEYCPSQQLPFPDLPLHSPSPPTTPRPYSCWDPPGQSTTQYADSQRLSHIVEANVSGGRRITWPGIRPYLTSYGEKSVNTKVDLQGPPNITCSENDLVDNIWSKGDISGQSSINLQNECRVQTVVPSSLGDISPSDDGVIVVADRQEGKGMADNDDFVETIKEQVDEEDIPNLSRKTLEAVDPVKFTFEPEHQWEQLPRLPPMRLRREVKLFNIHWERKYECDAPEILDTDDAFLLGSFLEVPIRQEISTTGKMLGGEMRDQFSLRYVYIEYAIAGYGRTKQQSFAVDPGGEVSPKLVFTMLFIVSWFPP